MTEGQKTVGRFMVGGISLKTSFPLSADALSTILMTRSILAGCLIAASLIWFTRSGILINKFNFSALHPLHYLRLNRTFQLRLLARHSSAYIHGRILYILLMLVFVREQVPAD